MNVFGVFMWFLGASSFLMQYICRVAVSVMHTPLMHSLSVNASELGQIAAGFYYPYLVMQLFVGRIVDRYAAHKVLIITSVLFLMGNQWFSEAHSMSSALFARGLQGIAGAFTFVVTMKLAMAWLDRRYLATFAALTQVMGMLGAALGSGLVSLLLVNYEWRGVLKLLSMATLALIVFMLIFLQSQHEEQPVNDVSLLAGLKKVMSNTQTWYNALYAGLIYLPTAAFGEFWGVDYLTHTNSVISEHEASIAVSMIFIGWAIGGVCTGFLSDYLGQRRQIMMTSSVLSLLFILPVLYINSLSAMGIYTCLMLYGMSNTGLVLAYAKAGEINGDDVSGVSIAFCNMWSILCGTIAMPAIGFVLDLSWKGQLDSGIRVYEVSAYTNAVALFPLALLLSFLAAYQLNETLTTLPQKKGL
ncbi:MFS transporter [Candidatus Comchoanobacter bicostacola]|uniref:Lysosomal dipeptide transporter MFSD1 n=1 Tax=Candidatus Comchoanobacter bicostacola TaxID=2919598 RepID=A0ABY5DKL2_9GAMM|nr:MFS transporter [Candidatus Comchoanobacter bicostacola]UTC24259.1 MFS transporter [Candidatus Comchoanobacter bicostacola]